LYPEDKERALAFSGKSRQHKKAFEFEYRMIAADGRIVWLRDIVSVIDEGDKPVQLRGIMVDITEQKKTEEEILRSNARFQTISKATSDIVWDWELSVASIWWNDNYYSLLGIRKQNELTPISDWYDRIHPEDLERVKRDMEKGLKDNLTFYSHEYRFAKGDGTYLHFLDRTFVMRNKEGRAYRMIGSMVNMTPIYLAQKVVSESENKLRTIIDSEPQCIKLVDEKGRLLDMNPAGLAMIEADSIEQVRGQSLVAIIDAAYKNEFKQLIRDVFSGKPGVMTFSITGMKGTKRWLETHAVPMKDSDGTIIASLGVTTDITDKRKAEEELIRNEEKYRTLVEQAVDAIALYDATGKILDVNTGSVNLLGYSRQELMQLSLPDILTPEEISLKPVEYDFLQMGQSTVKQRKMKKKDGSIVETEVRSQQLPDGRFLSVIRDLTERQKAQQQIEREKELSDKLIDSLPGVFYSYDEHGRFLRWNKQFEVVTGYSGKEIAGMHPTDFFEGEGRMRMQEKIDTVFSKGYSDTEEEFVSKDGSSRPYFFKAHRIIIDGKPCLLGTGIDISDRKKAEKELDESYIAIRKLTRHLQNIREQERTHIAREIHDELGQQLTVLKMDVSWLNKKVASPDETVREKMKSLLSMLDETVKTVRRISSELRPSLLDDLGLTAAMEWQLTEFEKRSGIHSRFIQSGEEVLLSDSVKTALFRIFQESLTNVARHSAAEHIRVSFVQEDDQLVLSIEDDGKGFDKQQVADKRTLGILGMKERTSMIDGTYEIVSAPGKGTVVTVKVPFIHS
jgi:PAS domain S-box-containing protein